MTHHPRPTTGRTSRARRGLRHAAAAAALVLVGSLSACGDDGGSGAPTDASVDDFCEAYNGLFEALMASGVEDGDTSKAIKALKDWAADMQEVGTPEDMPDDARAGYEQLIDTINDLDDDATEKDLEKLGEDMTDQEQKDGEAFEAYATEECGEPFDQGGPTSESSPSPAE